MGLLKALISIFVLSHTVGSLTEFSFKEISFFKEWMIKHNKNYTPEEYEHRLQTFIQKKRKIEVHNSAGHSFQTTRGSHLSSSGLLPQFVDWRKKGNYVTPVKNQGGCGSCWTFSTTGCLESVIAIKTGKLVSLAEQQLVDCAKNFKNHGCAGGLPSQAFEYIKYNNGLERESDYPYEGKDGPCRFQASKAAAFVKDVVNITECDEMGMMDAVARLNPVSFAFDVTDDFLSYTEGVYSNYFYIQRGKNMCGLAACASYPIALL
ncbi:hypothetical protein scyTo_0011853 [Scyliorhinus torazame]|uniref:Peptidase C1A papain C-terminal domain-containing protein n=1 Tax=Scyliorhinus torazame TaxID=75743 RepID=A0A401NWP4_SCYTO|nr:hypothetical protein [Scyliorhinus torazame]